MLLLSHQFGWEVRLLVGKQLEIVQSQLCRSHEVLTARRAMKGAMVEKGWQISR